MTTRPPTNSRMSLLTTPRATSKHGKTARLSGNLPGAEFFMRMAAPAGCVLMVETPVPSQSRSTFGAFIDAAGDIPSSA